MGEQGGGRAQPAPTALSLPGRALQEASSNRRKEDKRLFPFSILNLSGLLLIHTGESVLYELAFVPGKKKKKKKKEGNKHPFKSPFGSEGGKNNQADVSSSSTQAPSSGQEPPSTAQCSF